MAINQNRALSHAEMQADHLVLLAIRDLTDYTPHNPDYSTAALVALDVALTRAQEEELRLRNALEAARDATIVAAWAMHNAILGAKAQVIAQYGHDSNAVQAIGLKRKSERKRPARRNGATA
jgi:hypothetical protein